MNLITNLRHHVSTFPSRGNETHKNIGENFYYNGYKCNIIKKEHGYLVIKGVIEQFVLGSSHKEIF